MQAIESRLRQRLNPAPEPDSSSNNILLPGAGDLLMADKGGGVQLIPQFAERDSARVRQMVQEGMA